MLSAATTQSKKGNKKREEVEDIGRTALNELISEFIKGCYSANTRYSYKTALGMFLVFLQQEKEERLPDELKQKWLPFAHRVREGRKIEWKYNPSLPCAIITNWVDTQMFEGFKKWRKDQGDSNTSIRVRLAALRSFLALAETYNLLGEGVFDALELTPYEPTESGVVVLSNAQVRELRESITGTDLGAIRDRLIMDLMLFGGLRRSEVINLTMKDIIREGPVDEEGEYHLLIQGRGQPRQIKAHPQLADSLSVWLSASNKTPGDSEYVVEAVRHGTLSGQPLHNGTLGFILAQYTDKWTPDDLRRTCGRNAYENGAPLHRLQVFLGFSTSEQCARYIGVNLGVRVVDGMVEYIDYDDE